MSQDLNYKAVLERFQKDLEREIAFKKDPQNVLHLLKKTCEGQCTPETMSEIKGYYAGLETAKYLLEFAMFKQGMIDGLRGDTDGDAKTGGSAGDAGNDKAGDDNASKKSTKELNPLDLFALLCLGALGGASMSASILTEDDLKKMIKDIENEKGDQNEDDDDDDGFGLTD